MGSFPRATRGRDEDRQWAHFPEPLGGETRTGQRSLVRLRCRAHRARFLRHGNQAIHSANFDHLRVSTLPLTAITTACFCPTKTTNFLPRVMPVYRRFRRSIM